MDCTFRFARQATIAAVVIAASTGCDDSTKAPVAASLAFDVQPSNAIAGASISPGVRVRVLDESGAPYTGPMTVMLTLSAANGASLLGTTSVAAANGVATFADVRVEKAGTGYVLNASAASLPSVASNPFDVTHATAVRVRFLTPPTATVAGKPFNPPVTVELLDSYDNRAASARNAVTVALFPSDANTRVIGTTTVDAVDGVATFDKISLNRVGSFSLSATVSGLTSAVSSSFAVALAATSRFCPPDVSSGASFAIFTDAVDATESGGSIVVCDGTHQVTATLDRPLTVVAEHPHGATLVPFGPDRHVIWVREGGPGTYAFRDLNFALEGNNGVLTFGTAPFNPPVGRYDQVLIENNRFTVTSAPGYGVAVGISSSSIPTAKVIVRGNTFVGGAFGVRADAAGEVEISNNEFRDQVTAPFQHNASIELRRGGPYTVRNNVVRACPGRCIQSTASVAEISDNTVETSVESETRVGIEVVQGTATVSGNVIRGLGTVPNREDGARYGFKWAGLMVSVATERVSLTGNLVVNANVGVWVHASSRVAASDNTFTHTRWAIQMSDAGSVAPPVDATIHRNDFRDFFAPFAVGSTLRDGFASCNYWGSAAGPPSGNPAWYTPFSSVPIANKPEVTCQ